MHVSREIFFFLFTDNAKYVGDYRIGNQFESLNGFTFTFDDKSQNLSEDISLTKNCIPVHTEKRVTSSKGK